MVLLLKTKSCSKILNVYVPNYVCFAILPVCVVVRSRDTAQEAARQLAGFKEEDSDMTSLRLDNLSNPCFPEDKEHNTIG